MSGGSWDYLYYKVEDAASRLSAGKCPLRRAFGKHLALVSKALHDIEWVDSYDYSPGDERESIEAVLGMNSTALELKEARIEAEQLIEKMRSILERNT